MVGTVSNEDVVGSSCVFRVIRVVLAVVVGWVATFDDSLCDCDDSLCDCDDSLCGCDDSLVGCGCCFATAFAVARRTGFFRRLRVVFSVSSEGSAFVAIDRVETILCYEMSE